MKFLKLFFSRFLVIALAILLEFVIVYFSVTYWNKYSTLFRIINVLVALIVFLHLSGKKQTPELKIPWYVVIMAFPVFGTILYIMFSSNKPTKKQVKYLNESKELYNRYVPQTNKLNEELSEELGRFYGVENYLQKSSYTHGFLGSDIKFFSCGEDFYKSLITELKKAKTFILMEYFIIENGEMWDSIHDILVEKVKAGVEVKFLYDDMGTAGKVKGGYYKQLIEEGIECKKFNTFVPILSGIHNNRDHRKIVVIDGKTGFTGGINLADEYINKKQPFGKWKDTAIQIKGKAVSNLTYLFFQMFDINKSITGVDFDKYFKIDNQTDDENEFEGYIHPFGCGPGPYYEELVAENNFINMINLAKKSVYITTPYLIVDHALTNALRNASFRGVDVRIITPHIPDKKIVFGMTRSSYKYLMEAGIRIYEYTPGFIHAKQMLVDGVFAFVGTVNMDYRSLVHHYECGAVIYKSSCILSIKDDFDTLFTECEEQHIESLTISKFTQFVNAILSIFRPLF